jgi:transitional endoplasmic reticulum ATPase
MIVLQPSPMTELQIRKQKTTWEDVGGLKETKKKIRELVELPLLRPDLFKKAGIQPSKGVLLSGPPGTGKTLLAKAVANEANANFISIKGPELISKWIGESEKQVREIFKKARQVAPAIIFFDEFDSISKARGSSMSDATERVVNQLLTELDGLEELEKVIVIAATNRKDLIDEALLRPGRIDGHVELTIPNKEARKQILEVHTKNMPLAKEVNLEPILKNMEEWSGAEIEGLCRNAGLNAIKRSYEKEEKEITITQKDFEEAQKEITKNFKTKKETTTPEMPNMPDMNELMKQMPKENTKKKADKKKTSNTKNNSKKKTKKKR